jgi:2-oxoglutarate ferredoxin oxidoreductase subunit alpha
MAITTSSGPGIALKAEGIGLGIMMELPMLIIDVQRGGPSTGLPTKTEQSDLLQVLYGRNGESPIPVIAARSPADCFDVAHEAWRVATRLMTPVFILSDGFIANGSEPWKIPTEDELQPIEISHPAGTTDGAEFLPYQRDELLARPWALPGTEGLTHRLGGLEKEDITGNVSYDPDNHQHMTHVRAQKVENATELIGDQVVNGPTNGDLLVLSWGGTFGACATAVQQCQARGHSVAHTHLRWLNPFPKYRTASHVDSFEVFGRCGRLQQDQGKAVWYRRTGRADRATINDMIVKRYSTIFDRNHNRFSNASDRYS